MSLLDAAKANVRKRGPECSISRLLRTHPEQLDDIRELLAATPEPIPYTVAAETLAEAFDEKVLDDALSRHIRKRCSCEPA